MGAAPVSTSLVSLGDVRAAASRIAGVARRTPLIEVGGVHGEPAFTVKCENMQPTGAFKVRGAFNMLAQLSPDARTAGVITYSSGNHGQAVALAASRLGAPAVIVMPTTAPAIKVAGVKRWGAEVILDLSPAQGAIVEFTMAEDGLYPIVTHAFNLVGRGALGLFQAGDGDPTN